MAYQIPGLTFTLPLGAVTSIDDGDFDFRFGVATDGKAVRAGAGASAPFVIQQPAEHAADAETTCFANSVSKVVAGGTVTAGALVTSDATGRAVAATSGDFINGTCLEGGAVGELITVLAYPGGVVPA